MPDERLQQLLGLALKDRHITQARLRSLAEATVEAAERDEWETLSELSDELSVLAGQEDGQTSHYAEALAEVARAYEQARRPHAVAALIEPATHNHAFLEAIAESPGLSNKRVGERIGLSDETALSRAGRSLLDRGLVTRVRYGRTNGWEVTALGRRVLQLTSSGMTAGATSLQRRDVAVPDSADEDTKKAILSGEAQPPMPASGHSGMSPEHRAALELARREARSIKAYLAALQLGKSRALASRENVREKLETIEAKLGFREELLEGSMRQASFEEVVLDVLEEDFVETAQDFSERRGIAYRAWREVGVPAQVLRRAKIRQRRSR